MHRHLTLPCCRDSLRTCKLDWNSTMAPHTCHSCWSVTLLAFGRLSMLEHIVFFWWRLWALMHV